MTKNCPIQKKELIVEIKKRDVKPLNLNNCAYRYFYSFYLFIFME